MIRWLGGIWAGIAFLLGAGAALAADKVTFGTNWLAQAEHGGFYQAVADGTYAKYGLEVTIVPGGPQSNNRMMLAAGRLDFYMGGNLLQPFSAVAENIPVVVVAAIFQKDPQAILSRPGQGLDTWQDLKKARLFVAREGLVSYFQWMKGAFGFREDMTRPYTFNVAPFLADPQSAMEGYITSEPLAVEKQGGFRPNVFLLADYGFDTYSTTIETRTDVVAGKADLVQRFVNASIIGWYNYLYGDPAAANALIKTANPDMTDEQLAFSLAKMKEYGIVDSGDALKLGIGAMTDARIKHFFELAVKSGLADAGLAYTRSYTLAFVNKGVGLDLRR
ncbi:ABC transporter substrate-binding protein [Chelatococcus reniformis]|uniref:ABC transporter substrate-binding protein n=1 Tax=Chelatococcus reniformis TaxID=1494448 RepID=A0A916U934_9HYPH|nr:ABC transporter substrate-binding protein [Chelatococcus reniformis]GGC63708.1 ABC transporter substrate-binding protein [Chelatococcus reniformis]